MSTPDVHAARLNSSNVQIFLSIEMLVVCLEMSRKWSMTDKLAGPMSIAKIPESGVQMIEILWKMLLCSAYAELIVFHRLQTKDLPFKLCRTISSMMHEATISLNFSKIGRAVVYSFRSIIIMVSLRMLPPKSEGIGLLKK